MLRYRWSQLSGGSFFLTASEAERIVTAVNGKNFTGRSIERKEKKRNPVAPFIGNGFDQRGAPYVRVYNGVADIGAFEVQAPEPIDIAPKFTG